MGAQLGQFRPFIQQFQHVNRRKYPQPPGRVGVANFQIADFDAIHIYKAARGFSSQWWT
jgi:hypothetical protein